MVFENVTKYKPTKEGPKRGQNIVFMPGIISIMAKEISCNTLFTIGLN